MKQQIKISKQQLHRVKALIIKGYTYNGAMRECGLTPNSFPTGKRLLLELFPDLEQQYTAISLQVKKDVKQVQAYFDRGFSWNQICEKMGYKKAHISFGNRILREAPELAPNIGRSAINTKRIKKHIDIELVKELYTDGYSLKYICKTQGFAEASHYHFKDLIEKIAPDFDFDFSKRRVRKPKKALDLEKVKEMMAQNMFWDEMARVLGFCDGFRLKQEVKKIDKELAMYRSTKKPSNPIKTNGRIPHKTKTLTRTNVDVELARKMAKQGKSWQEIANAQGVKSVDRFRITTIQLAPELSEYKSR